jgi:aspartyl-tRNA synthetase
MLPFQLEDASRRVENQEDEEKAPENKEESKDGKMAVVGQDVRLNNRVIDLRVPANQALMRIQSAVGFLFREFLYTRDFVEIHSPKLIGGASEGGANVFRLGYFDQEACLAQSPQLYKQMVLCGDMQRVFEVGPVFRAEDSNTNRHLCEFTGLDIEMVFRDHYFEILDVLADLFVHIFKGLEERYAKEL